MAMKDSLGNVDFCPDCRRKIDTALDSRNQHRLYIVINREVKATNGRVPIFVCSVCQSLLQNLEIDGFEVILP
jgi:hypothetical protein